jgi:hypothetical protein
MTEVRVQALQALMRELPPEMAQSLRQDWATLAQRQWRVGCLGLVSLLANLAGLWWALWWLQEPVLWSIGLFGAGVLFSGHGQVSQWPAWWQARRLSRG